MFSSASFVYDSDMEFPAQLGVRILTVSYLRMLDWHYDHLAAPYWRFYWNFTSGGAVKVPESDREPAHTIELQTESGYLITPETDFSATCDHPIDHFFVHFSLAVPVLRILSGVYRLPRSRVLEPLVRELVRDMHPSPTTAAALAFAAFGQLGNNVVQPASSDPVVRAVDERIRRRPFVYPDLHALAGELGLSERTLRRRYAAAVGETPRASWERARIDHACILLHFGERAVDEIAEETGFSDRYHFTRVFSRHRGMGPAAFRKQGRTTAGF